MRFGWDLGKLEKQENDRFPPAQVNLFVVKSEQTIEIKPATEKNVTPVLRNLEAEFARIVELKERGASREWAFPGALTEWLRTIKGCRHKEFAPLLVRAIDWMPDGYDKDQLIATLYESFPTPEEGFAVLADYLSSTRPASALEVFEYWAQEDSAHKRSKERQAELKKPQPKDLIAETDEEAWQSSKRHLDLRLTKEQFSRLRGIKDVWVRPLLYAHYPDHCPPEWVDVLLKDLKQIVRPPEGIAKLVAKLDDDDFKIREQATRDLLELCRTCNWPLRDVNEDKLSTEAVARVRRVRANFENLELPFLWQSTIRYLARNSEPQAQKMFEILRTSDCRNPISEAAQEYFDIKQKRQKKRAESPTPRPEVKKHEEKK